MLRFSTADLTPPPFPLRPRRHRPDPPLAEVQVAEQKPFLDAGRQVQQVQDLAHPGSTDAQLPSGSGIALHPALIDQPLDVVGQGQQPGGTTGSASFRDQRLRRSVPLHARDEATYGPLQSKGTRAFRPSNLRIHFYIVFFKKFEIRACAKPRASSPRMVPKPSDHGGRQAAARAPSKNRVEDNRVR